MAVFRDEFDAFKSRLLEMGGLAEERVREAVHALVERDGSAIDDVIAGHDPLNRLQIEVDERGFRMLALYQPVATDLRAIMAGLKINTDLERVGDLAVN